jgi:DNA-binding transcriptional ArsR family regulator
MTKSADPDVRLLAALADPARLAIVRQLATDGAVCACDFSATGELAQPTVSHHLRVLREAGVVHGERRGTWIWYRLEPSIADRLAALAGELAAPGVSRPASALGSRGGAGRRRLPVVDLPAAAPAPSGAGG